ncbi:hypothetical protein J1N35_043146, partial [Gossypium stocksii]
MDTFWLNFSVSRITTQPFRKNHGPFMANTSLFAHGQNLLIPRNLTRVSCWRESGCGGPPRLLEVIGELVGKVVKLGFNTDSKTKFRFARMPVFVDLDKPLVSQVLVHGELQRVEYEALPTICFSCGKYSHLKKLCSSPATSKGNETGKISGFSEVTESLTGGEGLAFGRWMVVERKFKRGLGDLRNQREGDTEKESLGSIFSELKRLENL